MEAQACRLLVRERIAYIVICIEVFWVFVVSMIFLRFEIFLDFWVYANQPTVHNVKVSRGGSVAVDFGVSDW